MRIFILMFALFFAATPALAGEVTVHLKLDEGKPFFELDGAKYTQQQITGELRKRASADPALVVAIAADKDLAFGYIFVPIVDAAISNVAGVTLKPEGAAEVKLEMLEAREMPEAKDGKVPPKLVPISDTNSELKFRKRAAELKMEWADGKGTFPERELTEQVKAGDQNNMLVVLKIDARVTFREAAVFYSRVHKAGFDAVSFGFPHNAFEMSFEADTITVKDDNGNIRCEFNGIVVKEAALIEKLRKLGKVEAGNLRVAAAKDVPYQHIAKVIIALAKSDIAAFTLAPTGEMPVEMGSSKAAENPENGALDVPKSKIDFKISVSERKTVFPEKEFLELKNVDRKAMIVMRPTQDVPFGDLVEFCGRCRKLGFERIAFAPP